MYNSDIDWIKFREQKLKDEVNKLRKELYEQISEVKRDLENLKSKLEKMSVMHPWM